MADFHIGQISGPGSIGPMQSPGASEKPDAGAFTKAMDSALGKVNSANNEAEQAVENLAKGGDITDTMLAMEQADMSFQVMLEVRNQLISAYQEVMRMQV